jgi:hypothetical protein
VSVTPGAADDNPLTDPQRVRLMRRNLRSFAGMLATTRRLDEASQRHEDRMLTWSVGLMGGALFALPPVLNAACETTKGYALAAAPWALGVVCALVGRVVGGWHRDASRFHFAAKLGACHAILARSAMMQTARELASEILAVMNDTDTHLKVALARAVRLNWWAEKFYYATVVTLVAGIVFLLWRISSCQPR